MVQWLVGDCPQYLGVELSALLIFLCQTVA
ncbi:hypothetical protein Btaycd_013410 [Bartonella taylorii]|nr:hypothetical protein Btaycd_013410 [Bartonella taylorii]